MTIGIWIWLHYSIQMLLVLILNAPDDLNVSTFMNKLSQKGIFHGRRLRRDQFPLSNDPGTMSTPRSLPLRVSWWTSGMCLWQVGTKETKSNLLFLKAPKSRVG